MKVEKISGHVETNMKGNSFKIQLTRESFKNMVGNIYSNPIAAIIRELSCNAYDSHVAAGTPEKPFRVHLPTLFEPYLEIEDYGVGLDDKEIENVYTVLYNSTKTESNEFVGAFGIGAKSPFVYSDNFTVTATKNGVCRVYSMYISDEGQPSYSLMGESPTNVGNGLKVNMAVDLKDYTAFKQAATNILQYFKIQPAVNISLDESVLEIILEGEIEYNGNKIRYCFNKSHSGFVMGNIYYPYLLFHTISCLIDIPIGSFQIPMSREAISNNSENNQKINDIKKLIEEDARNKISEQLKNCETLVEAILVVSDIKTPLRSIIKNFVWQGKIINESIQYPLCLYCRNKYQKKYSLIDAIHVKKDIKILINDVDSDFKWTRSCKKFYEDEFKNKCEHNIYFCDKIDNQFFEKNGFYKAGLIYKASEVKLDKFKRGNIKRIFTLGNNSYNFSEVPYNEKMTGILVKLGDYRSNANFRYLQRIKQGIMDAYKKNVEIYAVYSNRFDSVLKNNKGFKDLKIYLDELESNDKCFESQLKEYQESKYDYNDTDYKVFRLIDDTDFNLDVLREKLKKLENNSSFKTKLTIFSKSVHKKPLFEKIIDKYPLIKFLDFYSIDKKDEEYVKRVVKQEKRENV